MFVNSREDSFDVERFVDAVVEVLDGSDVHVNHEKFGGWHVLKDDVVCLTFAENVSLYMKIIIRNMKNKLDYDMKSALNERSPCRDEWSLVKCIKAGPYVDDINDIGGGGVAGAPKNLSRRRLGLFFTGGGGFVHISEWWVFWNVPVALLMISS